MNEEKWMKKFDDKFCRKFSNGHTSNYWITNIYPDEIKQFISETVKKEILEYDREIEGFKIAINSGNSIIRKQALEKRGINETSRI